MPKVDNTRRQRAYELLARIKRGPACIDPNSVVRGLDVIDKDQAAALHNEYVLWANSWLVDEVIDLIPELRKRRDEQ